MCNISQVPKKKTVNLKMLRKVKNARTLPYSVSMVFAFKLFFFIAKKTVELKTFGVKQLIKCDALILRLIK